MDAGDPLGEEGDEVAEGVASWEQRAEGGVTEGGEGQFTSGVGTVDQSIAIVSCV